MTGENHTFLSRPELRAAAKSGFFQCGIALAIFLWLLDPVIDVLLFRLDNFTSRLLDPGLHEVYMRSITSAVILIFSFIAAVLLHRARSAQQACLNYRQIVFGATDFLSLLNRDYVFLAVNETYATFLGKSAVEIVGRSMPELHGRKMFEDRLKPGVDECIRTGHKINFECQYEIPGQGTRYMDITCFPQKDEYGGISGVILQARDITQCKQTRLSLAESEERYRDIVEHSPVLICTYLPDCILKFVNRAYSDYFQKTPEQLKGTSFLDLIPASERSSVRENIASLSMDSPVLKHEHRVIAPDGEIRWHRWTNRALCDENGAVHSYQAIGEDITERKRAENELLNRTERLLAHQKVLIQLAKEDFSDMDTSFNTIMRTDAGQLQLRRVSIWLYNEERSVMSCRALHHDGEICNENLILTREKFPRYFEALKNEGIIAADDACTQPATSEFTESYLKPLGITSMMDVPIFLEGEMVGIVCHEHIGPARQWTVEDRDFAVSIADMCALVLAAGERKHATDQLTYQASHDPLTGLNNRFEFERCAERLLLTATQGREEHALCFLDLDQFKVVNDTCGHTAGDELLRQLSTVIQDRVRKHDILARLGGDEFAVLMEHCSLEDAQRLATTLQQAIQESQFVWQDHSFRVGVSIGLVPINAATGSVTELLKQADAACYIAKDLGRHRIHTYHPEDEELARRHGEMLWVTRITSALETDSFCLYAQPIVPLRKGLNSHYEILIRMVDANGEHIPPGVFLPAAERFDLVSRLDRWVIEKAFDMLGAYPSFLQQVHAVSINLSGQSLVDTTFPEFILERMNNAGIDAGKICFEITETAAISRLNLAMRFISTMKAQGCRFALDDFGSGLSSFGYLKNLDVDYLKIDGMFVRDIAGDPIDHAMVKSINEIGQVMGKQTIAEFVENDEIKGMLREIGIDYAQGYGVGKPVPIEQVLAGESQVSEFRKLE